ncbi:GNAT family N-acetyltransferase [Modicisalibacter coralii]|uniref:GNAT family N-acetyltransferase n=1 Tax=Modicisalibacter coralii TaxID=2304602 RepID=UPI00100BAC2F|nr:GNAT family N-acetyltransferase [Halomonas coralii]
MRFAIETLNAVEALPATAWNALVPADQPFLRHEFLHALEASGAVSPASGWTPRHLAVRLDGVLVALLPRYLKDHSFGEYVFDWAWADAWERAGGDYYPKGLTAVPFTPVPGARLLMGDGAARREVMAALGEHCCDATLSSWHLLFAEDAEIDDWLAVRPELLERAAVQFQWRDAGFGDFAGFLAAMSAKRRKEVRRERRRVAEQGLELVRLEGEAIDAAALEHFYRCYRITYYERGQQPYLSLDFFRRLRETMPEALLLVQAWHGARPVAAALCLQGSETLYGRYWGSEVEADCLHFEACYYQGIEHCLAKGLTRFDPGTQGEHKLSRGFAPRRLRSLHFIAHRGFRDAVARFCAEEREHVAAYARHAETRLPFRRDHDAAGEALNK